MKFLSLYYTHKPGGLCKRLYRLLHAIEREHLATYLCLDTPPVEIRGFRKIWFPWKARKGLVFWCVFGVISSIHTAIVARKERPEVLIAFHPIYALLLWPAAMVSRGKVALFFRAIPHKTAEVRGERLAGALLKIIEYAAVLVSTRVFLISNAMKAELPNMSQDKVRVVPNDVFIDTKFAEATPLPVSNRRFRVLSSGVFDARKNIEVIVEAIALLAPDLRSQICVYLVGDGDRRLTLQSIVQERGLAEHFVFTGWIHEFSLPEVDLVLHPAKHEGLSNSILEALAKRVPVLASNIPEHSEFFPPAALFSSAAELSARLAELVAVPGALKALSSMEDDLRKHLKFDWEKRVIQYMA